MKSIIFLGLIALPIFFQAQAADYSMPLNQALSAQRLKITFSEELNSPFGEAGSFILQKGELTSKNNLNKKEPYCTLTPDSFVKDQLSNAFYEKDQDLIGGVAEATTTITVGGFSFSGFSLGKKPIVFNMYGTFLDAQKGGFKGSDAAKIELTPRSITLSFDCRNLDADVSVAGLKEVVGSSVFNVKLSDVYINPYELVTHSRYMKDLEAKKIAEAEAKKQKDKADFEAAIAALGPEASSTRSLADFKTNDSVTINKSLSSYVRKSGYIGNISQNGEDVGVVSTSTEIFTKKTAKFELDKPYCKISATKYRVAPLSLSVPVLPGIYSVSDVAFYKAIRTLSFTLTPQVSTTNESANEVYVSCSNVETVADLSSVFAENVKYYLKGEQLVDPKDIKTDEKAAEKAAEVPADK